MKREREFECPWCGAVLEKGTMIGPRYGFQKEGNYTSWTNPLKALVETEEGVFFANFTESPVAYACRTCRKIILPY